MNRKILLVEDDATSRRMMELLLTKEGFQVITAANGLDGLKKARTESPDLLVLDVMLPGLDGFEVCFRLRKDPATTKLPILIQSAKGQDSDRDAALQVGANVFLPKPIERQVLFDKIAELLKAAIPGEPEKPVKS